MARLHGNRVTTTDAMGQVWKEGFDERGHRISRTDPLGRTWTYESNLAGQVTKILDPEGLETKRNTYDAKGRLVSVTDAAGNVSTTTYDALDRVTSRTDALGRKTTYAYDVKQGATGCESCGSANRAPLTTLHRGRKIARTYDADRRLLTETGAAGGRLFPRCWGRLHSLRDLRGS